MGGRLPPDVHRGSRQPDQRCGRPHVHRLRARRHRCDGRPFTRADRTGGAGADRHPGRYHDDVAERGCRVGRRGTDQAFWSADLVLHAERDRCESLGDPARPARHRTAEGTCVLLLLPRVGRRGVHRGRLGWRTGEPARQRRTGGRSGRDHPSRRVERCGGVGTRTRVRGRGRDPGGASPDKHRHCAARAGLPRDGRGRSPPATAAC